MTPDILAWKSGCVKRWHCSPSHGLRESGDTTGWHSQRVALLILMLHPLPSSHLLACALTHDTAEIVTGDIPAPVKVGSLHDEVSAVETVVCNRMGLPVLSKHADALWLMLCDKLDAYLWAREHAPEEVIMPAWREQKEDILAIGEQLEVKDKLKEAFKL